MKIKIGWWKIYSLDPDTLNNVCRYNYHVKSMNGNILLSTNQGYEQEKTMLRIAKDLFPDAVIEHTADRYSKNYFN